MDFVSNQKPQIEEMLATIGVESVEDLFVSIPEKLRCAPSLEDDGLSEQEGVAWMRGIAAKNSSRAFTSYLGAGAYEHHVPAIVSAITSKSEFLTAYTPYQAEASQGGLQVIFEFQSAICALTGMDVANASLYDAASACAEALLLALRHHKKRKRVWVAETLHPHYQTVLRQYLAHYPVEICTIPSLSDGRLDPSVEIDTDAAAVLLQYPSVLGIVEEVPLWAKRAQDSGALLILCANPLAYGLYASAGELGADIAVGDCQPFGIPLQYGGPYAGYLSCRNALKRQMPGRLVGQTMDAEGKRGYVLTLQAREQHIRREKASSNICTNQALCALASLVAILWYGKEGVPHLARTNYQRATYLKSQLAALPHVHLLSGAPTFNEFAVHFSKDPQVVQEHFRKAGIEPGVDLSGWYPQFSGHFLVCVTETKSLTQLDHYVETAKQL